MGLLQNSEIAPDPVLSGDSPDSLWINGGVSGGVARHHRRGGRSLVSCVVGLLLAVAIGSITYGGINDRGEVVADYAKGRRLMREGDYLGASRHFEHMKGQYPDSKNLDLFVFHRAQCDYHLGQFSAAAVGFEYFLSHFGDSPEVPYGHFFLANCHHRLSRVTDAVESYLEAYRLSHDKRLDEIVGASLEAAFETASSVSLDPALLNDLPQPKRCRVIRAAAARLTSSGDAAMAERLLASCGGGVDHTLPEYRPQRRSEVNSIAVMLPFSGEMGGYGQEIYNGAVIAAEQLRQEADFNPTLVPYDTKGDPLDAARIAVELSRDESVLAAIGPLTSEEAAVTSAALACRSLPLIVPAATQAGLTGFSDGTFQLSPNTERQGLAMAHYAVDSLHADTAVIVTSTATDHLRMARAFADRFEKLGGTVAAVEYYRSRDKDFGPYLRDIKALIWGLPPDSIFFTNEYGDTLDPDGIPVTVDCMYLPGSPQQLRLLLPQIRFYKIETVYLGSDAWADEEVLRLGHDVTGRAVFPSPFLGTDNSEEYLRFAAAYDARFGKRPSRLASIGFDALRLVGLTAREAEGDREKLTALLTRTADYRGAAGRITLSAERENRHMPLYRIVDGAATPLASQTTVVEEAESEQR